MAATLADVNATLGVTNIALSSVVTEQKETNKGITAFVDFIKDKDADDSRRALEDKRESKPILKSIGSGASAIGGGLVSAGKSTFGFGKGLLSKLAIPAGFVGGFLTSLLSSKLLKGGILGLAFMFGDEIAEMLTGPDAKKEVKDQVAGAIKGGAVGFLFGPRFGLIGTILGGLLANKEIDKQAGDLIKTLEDMEITLPSLSNIFKSINTGVADGLKGINAMLKGNFSVDSTVDALKLLGGAAFLISPAGSLFLLKGMARTRIGRVLMALAGIGYATGLLGGNSGDSKAGSGGVDDAFANNIKNKSAAGKVQGGDVGGFTSIFKGLDTIDTALLVSGFAYLTKQVADLGIGMYNMFTGSFSKKVVSKVTDSMGSLIKNAKGLGGGFLKGLLSAGRFGMSMVGNLPVLLPLAAMGGLLAVLNNKESSEKLAMSNRATKSSGTTSKEGSDFYKGTTGFIEDFQFDASNKKSFIGANRFSKPGINSNLSDYFKNLPPLPSTMDPTGNGGNVISTNTVNSGNVYNSAGFAINSAGANDPRNMFGKSSANATGLF